MIARKLHEADVEIPQLEQVLKEKRDKLKGISSLLETPRVLEYVRVVGALVYMGVETAEQAEQIERLTNIVETEQRYLAMIEEAAYVLGELALDEKYHEYRDVVISALYARLKEAPYPTVTKVKSAQALAKWGVQV